MSKSGRWLRDVSNTKLGMSEINDIIDEKYFMTRLDDKNGIWIYYLYIGVETTF